VELQRGKGGVSSLVERCRKERANLQDLKAFDWGRAYAIWGSGERGFHRGPSVFSKSSRNIEEFMWVKRGAEEMCGSKGVSWKVKMSSSEGVGCGGRRR